MNSELLSLPHKNYEFRIVKGVVKDANMWSESRTEGGGGGSISIAGWGGGRTKKVKTTVTNKLEFWVETEDGKERHYAANADKVKIRKDQEIEVLELVNTKPNKMGAPHLVCVHIPKQETVYQNMGGLSVASTLQPAKTILTVLYVFPGILLSFAPDVALFYHIGLTVIGVLSFRTARRFSQQIQKIINDLIK